jgi:hypothetical protein
LSVRSQKTILPLFVVFVAFSSCSCEVWHTLCFWSILWSSQSGDHPYEDLAKCGYNINMKLNI